jgi:hypothetical protein
MIDCGTYRFDRCDRCGAKGVHKAIRNDRDLIMCQHHYNQFSDALTRQGWLWASMEPLGALTA